ncbi:hypothetical protein ABVK25_011228 [Lepraria finkii]|uniref:Uncharacterized protein n=1 Tax=Lepraria finkii TaxID=1340010 RepID=A0ABR4ASQ9_9LECA
MMAASIAPLNRRSSSQSRLLDNYACSSTPPCGHRSREPSVLSNPPGTQPSTNENLPVAYGTTKVTPGITLDIALTKMFPTMSYTPASTNQTYVILLVDLSISAATVNQSALTPDMQLPLAPGVNADRTTRLHY